MSNVPDPNDTSPAQERETDFTQARMFLRDANRRIDKAMVRVQRGIMYAEGLDHWTSVSTYRRIAADLRKVADFLDVVRLHVDGAETKAAESEAH